MPFAVESPMISHRCAAKYTADLNLDMSRCFRFAAEVRFVGNLYGKSHKLSLTISLLSGIQHIANLLYELIMIRERRLFLNDSVLLTGDVNYIIHYIVTS